MAAFHRRGVRRPSSRESLISFSCHFDAHARCFAQVPEKTLDYQLVREPVVEDALESEPALTIHDDDVSGGGEAAVVSHQHGRRRLSLSR
jgi:hypothetical protein